MNQMSISSALQDTVLNLPVFEDGVSKSGSVSNGATKRRAYPPITVKIASTRAEREGAFRLVYQRYLSSGLCAPNPHEMRITPYHLLDTTTIFTAHYQGEVIFTVSLVGDSEHGVPMESIFPDEIRGLRDCGIRFGEISCLADRRKNLIRFLPLFVQVTSLMFQHAIREGPYRFVIAVHPKHGKFYERFFGFRPIADVRPYSSVQNRPAMAYALDSTWLLKERHEQYFGKVVPAEELLPQPMSEAERRDFAPVAYPLGERELLSGGYDLTPTESNVAVATA